MYLKKATDYLGSKIRSGDVAYSIPREWLPLNYKGKVKLKDSFIFVNPYELAHNVLDEILQEAEAKRNYLNSISKASDLKDTSWVKNSIIYCSLPRSSTAFPHENPENITLSNEKKYTETGTLLKMSLLLPYLKRMGINTVYFLPLTKYSNKFKKGEIGSPYSVKNFFEIDSRYHDSLLSDFHIDEEFKVFMEASHILGIRVILDFIPRTSSRDADLILKHPDWFYWIKADELDNYKPPSIPELGFEIPSVEKLDTIYSNAEVKLHLKKFSLSPDKLNPEKWGEFVEDNRDNPDFLDKLVETFNVITPPGFSDWVNDNQPTWNDVTFLRLFKDHPDVSKGYLENPNQPPYVLFDVVKSSLFPGKIPNDELWKTITDIMPFYNREFGVDGARLDMGHALPLELEKSIISTARKQDPSFAIIAEELAMSNDKKAAISGYDCILGNTWWMEPRGNEGRLKELCNKVLPNLSIPALGAIETPDTPRAVAREGGKKFSKFTTTLNFFLPNTIPFINSGQEIFELQPMNLGLDNNESGRYVLSSSDPFYGKIAFFDHYVLHWNSSENIIEMIGDLSKLKKEYNDLIRNENLRVLFGDATDPIGYFFWNGKKGFLLVANDNFSEMKNVTIDLGYHTWKSEHNINWIFTNYSREDFTWIIKNSSLNFDIGPGEIKIGIVN